MCTPVQSTPFMHLFVPLSLNTQDKVEGCWLEEGLCTCPKEQQQSCKGCCFHGHQGIVPHREMFCTVWHLAIPRELFPNCRKHHNSNLDLMSLIQKGLCLLVVMRLSIVYAPRPYVNLMIVKCNPTGLLVKLAP